MAIAARSKKWANNSKSRANAFAKSRRKRCARCATQRVSVSFKVSLRWKRSWPSARFSVDRRPLETGAFSFVDVSRDGAKEGGNNFVGSQATKRALNVFAAV